MLRLFLSVCFLSCLILSSSASASFSGGDDGFSLEPHDSAAFQWRTRAGDYLVLGSHDGGNHIQLVSIVLFDRARNVEVDKIEYHNRLSQHPLTHILRSGGPDGIRLQPVAGMSPEIGFLFLKMDQALIGYLAKSPHSYLELRFDFRLSSGTRTLFIASGNRKVKSALRPGFFGRRKANYKIAVSKWLVANKYLATDKQPYCEDLGRDF